MHSIPSSAWKALQVLPALWFLSWHQLLQLCCCLSPESSNSTAPLGGRVILIERVSFLHWNRHFYYSHNQFVAESGLISGKWLQPWFHGHELKYELTSSILLWFYTMNSYVTFHDLWIQIWIHAYQEYSEVEALNLSFDISLLYHYSTLAELF